MIYFRTLLLFLFFFLLPKVKLTGQTQYEITLKYSLENFKKMKMIQKHLQFVNIYNLNYRSFDDTKIKGFLILPNDPLKKYPVLIFNRGGNGKYGMVTDPYIVKFLARIASKGFIIIGSQLRGSDGSEGTDEFAGKDINDVLTLFNIIDNIKIADTSKIGQIGWSRGGITNFQLLKKTSRIKTTINIAGPSNILSTNRKEMFNVYRNRIRNYSLDSVYYSNKVSPFFQIDSIVNKKESFLFLHGAKDDKVDISQSHELFKKIYDQGYETKLIIYKDSDHSLFTELEKVIDDIINWLNKANY